MYHSITIGGKNTWDDWRLVPASRPVFNPPAQKVKTLEIPGGDGVIDLSQSLTGYPVYQNRTGSIEFIVMNDFKPWHSNGKKEAQLCGIAIYFEGRGFITKWDGAEDSDIEAVKGGLSDSMKRAAVQWGIGRVLYDLNTVWVEIEKRGRSFVIKDSERAKLDNAYLSALKCLGLTPAAACGIQSLLTPKTLPGQTAPEENAPAANPQPKQGNSQPTPASATQRADRPAIRSASQQTLPAQQSRAADSRTVPFTPPQSAARQRTDCYVVLNTKVQGGMSGSSTLVTLRAPDGKQIPAFARGARPELSAGTVLSNVKITMRQQDTVAFYVLESYEIVPQEDRAA